MSSAEVLSPPWVPREPLLQIDRLRELFLMQPHADLSGIRPIVARSWYRSRAAGVDAVADRGFFDEGRVDEHTIQAAGPHLQKLDEVAADLGGYVNLTAPNGVLVKADYLRDDGFPPAGYSLLEESCGSNGEGLALKRGGVSGSRPKSTSVRTCAVTGVLLPSSATLSTTGSGRHRTDSTRQPGHLFGAVVHFADAGGSSFSH